MAVAATTQYVEIRSKDDTGRAPKDSHHHHQQAEINQRNAHQHHSDQEPNKNKNDQSITFHSRLLPPSSTIRDPSPIRRHQSKHPRVARCAQINTPAILSPPSRKIQHPPCLHEGHTPAIALALASSRLCQGSKLNALQFTHIGLDRSPGQGRAS